MTSPNDAVLSTPKPSRAALITGWILSAIPILFMAPLAIVIAIVNPAMMAEGMKKYGYPDNAMYPIVIAEIVCAVIYAIPQTATLGAILLSAYLGGAVATHVHAGEPFFFPIIIAVLVWLGLLLREPRLRLLLPIRRIR